jgi:lipopolysaccharide/colanic/teichoic acid biosynthesis glycosyltransferase
MKRAFDFALAALGLCILWPLFVVLAAAVRLSSSGPALYRGRRAGRGGQPFFILKFRTMVVGADKMGGPSTASDDPRLTRVGKWLRKYKLDELPQLINVLAGEMSLVGPRPEVPSEVEAYSPEERELLTVRPGITDWASLRFRDEGQVLKGSLEPHQTYREKIRPEKIRLGLQYVHERSFRTDLQILLETIKLVTGLGRRAHAPDTPHT